MVSENLKQRQIREQATAPKLFSLRIHEDWWGRCRTCQFWTGDRATMDPGTCNNPRSDLHGQETWTDGECKRWDSYDTDTALEVLAHDYVSPWNAKRTTA